MDKNSQLIRDIVESLLKTMGFFDCVVDVLEIDSDNKFTCNIKTQNDANLIIGQSGDNLQAMQHIARLLVRKSTEEPIKFILDVNFYKKDQESSVVELAKLLAEQVIKDRKAVIMRPTSAYNRRLVHIILAENKNVITESTGDANERRIIIKPALLN
jgi:spoIIIJ-associated protein